MSYFIIIRGPAGVGKSTVSKVLAKKLNMKLYHYDRVMKGFGFNFIPGDKWVPLEKYLEADKLMMPKYKDFLSRGKRLLLDGNFYHIEQIENLIDKLEYPHLVITLNASLPECQRRNKTRLGQLKEDAVEEVFGLQFDVGIVIDTEKMSEEEVAEKILSELETLSDDREREEE